MTEQSQSTFYPRRDQQMTGRFVTGKDGKVENVILDEPTLEGVDLIARLRGAPKKGDTLLHKAKLANNHIALGHMTEPKSSDKPDTEAALCVRSKVYTATEHDRWRNRSPNPWPCPACAALREAESRALDEPHGRYYGSDDGVTIEEAAGAFMDAYARAMRKEQPPIASTLPESGLRDEQSLPQREGPWKGPYVQPNSSGQINAAGPELPAVTSARPIGRTTGGTVPIHLTGDSAQYPAPAAPAEVPTPRVEEEVVLIPVGVEGLEAEFVHAEFARQLERELAFSEECRHTLQAEWERLSAETVSARPLTERALMGLGVLDNVDKLLTERGYQEDSSTRHQLSIARSILKEELEAAALSTKSRSTYRCTICGVEYLEALSATTEQNRI